MSRSSRSETTPHAGDPAAGREAPRRLVFLCSGNMVRSAFAELYARHLSIPCEVRSAATTYRNERIHPAAARALRGRGVPEEWIEAFRPTHLDDLLKELERPALFLGMRYHHLEALPAVLAVDARLLLGDEEIADPVLEGADFGTIFGQVARGVETYVAETRGRG